MRLVVLLIPIALVGGYVVHSLSNPTHHPERDVEPPAPPVPPAAPVAPAPPVAPPAPATFPRLALVDMPFDTEFDAEGADGRFRVRGAGSASLAAAVEGALQLVSRRLAEGDSVDAELVAELVTWSATLLADVAADVEGYLEIETPDGERVVINAAGRPSVRVEAR